MSERYEKRGATVRFELSARGQSTIMLREGGFAVTSSGGLRCEPLPPGPEVALSPSTFTEGIAKAVETAARGRAVVERLSIVEGRASHRFVSGTKRRRWQDAQARLFISLVRQPCGRRAALSLGAVSPGEIDLGPISSVCQALALPESLEPLYATSVTLEPWVAASLVRALADERAATGAGLRIAQNAPEDTHDGHGKKVRRRIVRQSDSTWPECFRPSYRFAPIFTPLHVELLGAGEENARLDFAAVALASAWVRRSDVFLARVWIVDRMAGSVSFGKIVVDPKAMSRATAAMTGPAAWFPEGAGAWGRRLTLTREAARVQSA